MSTKISTESSIIRPMCCAQRYRVSIAPITSPGKGSRFEPTFSRSIFWLSAWETLTRNGLLRMLSPLSKAESANWYNSISQIMCCGRPLNFNEFREGKANRCDRINFGPLYWRWLA